MKVSLFDIEELQKGNIVCGVDEVGRGPLAGPVVAAAVILPEDFSHPDIRDSKKLNSEKIKKTADIIEKNAVAVGIGMRDAQYIDDTDILTATFEAMRDAVNLLSVRPSVVLIDGSHKNPYIKNVRQIALVKGESKSVAIAAASIIAKNFRDNLMRVYAVIYPQYQFERHKGYGTVLHKSLLERHGLSPIHRKSFCGIRVAEQPKAFI